ncbi:MAG TPA: hypothetical protein VNZ53_37010 [Steroidobacteraceae bacterium]|nr:hypothetical protein [Steroidobacteraceae bacterium]
MGELAPPWKRDSERLFERCLLLARQSPDTAQQRFLLAYALFKLNLRTAADQVLRGQLAPAPIALRAIIDGNLTGTARLASKSTGHERLILEFELHDLSVAYNHVGEAELPLPPALMVLSKGSDSWAILLHQRWDISRRTPKDNVPLKRLLDKFYPIDGQSLIDLAAAHKATPGAGLTEWDLQLMVHRHVRELMVDKSASWCCSRGQGLPAPWDYVSVIEAWSDENLFHDVDYQLSFLGLPEKARVLLSALDPIYNGQPDFEILQAEAERAMAAKMPQAQQVAFLSAVHRHALQALSGAGGQDADAIYAMSLLGAGDATATELARIYGGDYPFYPYWLDVDFAIDPSKRLSLAKIALASTQTGVGFASLILQDSGEAGKSDVRAAISGRFIGNPALDQVLEQLRPTSLNIDTDDRQLIARLRGQVAEKPEVFETRSRLAKVLVDQGQYAAAGKVLTAFPEFRKKTATDGVYLSNLAGESGHMFYWRGAEREARELYSIATRYHVGSESEMIAELHMALLDGNMEGALRAAGERAERYPNGLSYCNYISLLHLMGRSDEAWQIFNLLTDQPMGFPPWESAMVGLRMAGTDQNGLTRWIAQPKITRAGTPAISYAAHFLTVWNTTDRMAPFDFAERVATLTDERTGIIEGDGRVASYPTNKPGNRFLVVRSDFRADQRAVMTLGTRVDSDEILFARALVKSQHGDFSTAVSRFDDLAARYPIEREVGDADATYALPDFAYASAKSGDPLSLERFLTGLPSDAQFFTLYLAKAYFDALTHKKNDAALSDLDDAFSFMNHIFGATPSNEYQFADVAERLYRETKDPRFRDRSVRWAHSFQRLQPWAAWAYVVEAKLSVDSSARRTALVRALFLDPLSPRLNAIPDAELVAAREELRKGNPFVRRTDANPRTVALSRAALEIAP